MVAKILQSGVFLKNNSYRIRGLLGQGGFGAVYLADDLILEKLCAIKESFDNSPGIQAQFEVEARILSNLSHPHLPRVTDNFIEQGSGLQYLVMEYVQGQNLGELLEKSGPSAEEQVLAWADQVLDALAYLHAQQPRPIIHRDVKPDNIRLLPDGKTVKLVDFGIAKLGGAAEQTRKGARGASPGYSPPEQYGSGTGPYSDVYSFGATLYHLLTNVLPPDAIDRAYSGAQLLPPRQLNPAISEAMEQVILTAMQLQPSLRFPDAAEMRTALQNRRISDSPTRVQVQPQSYTSPAATIVIPTPRSILLDTAQPDTSVHNLADLIRLCDQNWPAAVGWLKNGRIAAVLNFLGENQLELSASQAGQGPDPRAGLEALLRAAGAKPPRQYRANIKEVIHALGFGLSLKYSKKPDKVRLTIKNISHRGYLHGSVISLAPWLSLHNSTFGCLPGETASLDLNVDQQLKKLTKLALRTALFEIDFR